MTKSDKFKKKKKNYVDDRYKMEPQYVTNIISIS